MEFLASTDSYRRAFADGLAGILEHEGLGTFILATANAGTDPLIGHGLHMAIRTQYTRLLERHRHAIAEGRQLDGAEEDIAVFLKIACVGLDALKSAEQRSTGAWRVHFNHLRSFRPRRMTAHRPDALHRPFDAAGFHFNKPFLRREELGRGRIGGREAALLYNKYPFAELHALLAPEPEAERPQFLEREWHLWAAAVANGLAPGIDDVGLGYNAYGAYASVNHLHFHLFTGARTLPATAGVWRHNGGTRPYPAACRAFAEPEAAWDFIASLHAANTAYNLLYVPGRIYCFPRAMQGSHRLAEWNGGFAWHEMAGGIITANRADFERLEADGIARELAATIPDGLDGLLQTGS